MTGLPIPSIAGIVLFAVLAATGAMLMAYKRGFREWQDDLPAPNPNTFANAPRTPRITLEPAAAPPDAAAPAAKHGVASVDVHFKRPTPAEKPEFPWLSHCSYVWLLVWALGGLVLALAFFALRWNDRGAVALWYAAGFTVWALAMWIAIRAFE